MNSFRYNSYPSEIHDLPGVIQHMLDLEHELQGSHLQNLRHFTRTYRFITEAVYEQCNSNTFQNNTRMQQFDIQFAYYYFNALKGFATKQPIPPAWHLCFEFCQKQNTSPTIAMALGVNAHVNNDLPQTLADCNYGEGYKSDYDKINVIIKNQIPAVIESLEESKQPFTSLEKIPNHYYSLLSIIIVNWRNQAWNDHIKLLNNKKSVKQIENQAKKIADLLLFL